MQLDRFGLYQKPLSHLGLITQRSNSRVMLATRPSPYARLTLGGYTHFDNRILDRENFSMAGIGRAWSLYHGRAVIGRETSRG